MKIQGKGGAVVVAPGGWVVVVRGASMDEWDWEDLEDWRRCIVGRHDMA